MNFKPAASSLLKLASFVFAIAVCGLSMPSWAGKLARPDASSARIAGVHAKNVKSAAAVAEVVEYYHQGLDNYFITAEAAEQAAVDAGAAGAFFRTGNSFAAGGTTQVCRFYGNTNINPATGGIYGPNSHFYTADPTECASLVAQFDPNAKSWKFESNDFLTTPATNGACPANLVPVYRAYNNGFARGVDSNHRITSNHAAYLQTVAGGWAGEGIVMCAPQPTGNATQYPACSDADCPEAFTTLGSGTGLVNVVVEIPNTTAGIIEFVVPAGTVFIATPNLFQDGLSVDRLQVTIAPGTTGRFLLRLFCMHQDREGSSTEATYAQTTLTTNAQLLDVVSLASGKLGATLDPAGIKSVATQFAIWEITNGTHALSATQRSLYASLLNTGADDLATQADLFQQFQLTLSNQG